MEKDSSTWAYPTQSLLPCALLYHRRCRYITYGEQEWREATEGCLKRMELYDETSE